jgi:thiol peroxidase
MGITALKGTPIHTTGDLPTVGSQAPTTLGATSALADVDLSAYAGKNVVLNIFPSIDTPVCATSVRTFNARAASLPNTAVVCVSADLPFALSRFCGAEGLENVQTVSTFRSSFGADWGVTLADGPLRGVLARAVVVVGPNGTVLHTELVPEIAQEPNYDAALAVIEA